MTELRVEIPSMIERVPCAGDTISIPTNGGQAYLDLGRISETKYLPSDDGDRVLLVIELDPDLTNAVVVPTCPHCDGAGYIVELRSVCGEGCTSCDGGGCAEPVQIPCRCRTAPPVPTYDPAEEPF